MTLLSVAICLYSADLIVLQGEFLTFWIDDSQETLGKSSDGCYYREN